MTNWLKESDYLTKISHLENIKYYNLKHVTTRLKKELENAERMVYSFQSIFDDIHIISVNALEENHFSNITYSTTIDEDNIVKVSIKCEKTELFNDAFQVFYVSFYQPANHVTCTMECSYIE